MKDQRPDDRVLRCRVCHNPIPPPDHRNHCGTRCEALDDIVEAAHETLDDAHGSLAGPALRRALNKLEKAMIYAGEREPIRRKKAKVARCAGV